MEEEKKSLLPKKKWPQILFMFLIKKNKVIAFIPYFIFSKNFKKKYSNNLGGLITSRISYVKVDVPIIISFRALGLESDKDIMDYTVFVENDNTFKKLLRLSVDFSSDYHGKK